MSNPRTPASQLFYGPMYGDRLAQQIPHLAGQNPATLARMRRHHGRYLAGFGQSQETQRMLLGALWMLPAAYVGAWVGASQDSVGAGFLAGAVTGLVTAVVGSAMTA